MTATFVDASADILAACRRLRAGQAGRKVPSPSSAGSCTRELWFKARGYPQDNFPDNGESYISAETGRWSEALMTAIVVEAFPAWRPLYDPADEAGRELTPHECERINAQGGQVDNVLVNQETGEEALLELKRKSVYSFLDVKRKGVIEGAPRDYTQMQLLMYAKKLPQALYFVANYDRAALTRSMGKGKERLDGVYAVWVPFNLLGTDQTIQAMGMQGRVHVEVDDPALVPRIWEGQEINPKEGKWPCTWCDYMNACKAAGG